MLNEERIILMTKTAAYEGHEGKKNMAIDGYFRSDYMELNVIKSLLYSTLAFLLVVAMIIYYQVEVLLQDIYKMDLLEFGKNVLFYYFIFVVIYAVIVYIVSSFKYYKARKTLKKYYHHLKQLSAMYDLENRK